jgi:class 3 adenylate cyclase/HAMP domain-containing protein
MKIRSKVLMVILPLLVFPLLLIGVTSFLSAKSGITRIARDFLSYKVFEMYKYCRRQEDIITETGLVESGNYRELAKKSAQEYADAIRLSDTGYFMILNSQGDILSPESEKDNILESSFFPVMTQNKLGMLNFSHKGINRVGYYMFFESWDWFILLSENEEIFYQDANNIRKQVAYTMGITLVLAIGLILFFIKKLTDPIGNVVSTMKDIMTSSDLSKRVRIEFDDEVGYLATWFNRMVEDLELAYNQIKQYAYKSVLAQKSEERIRHIFQKYVPAEIIDEVLKTSGDQLLVGKKQVATILFSDIRSFTTISEILTAEDLVTSLNTYFNIMVSIIIENNGIIDKFIGDAIMAIFGAPVLHEDDPYHAVLTGLTMLESLKHFNRKQRDSGTPPFKVGIGLNTGSVVVGNIGSTQKLEYTCIGDTVNLASRLEGLTKLYDVPIIISEFTYREIAGTIEAREIDSVRVKGKSRPVKIFQPYLDPSNKLKEGFETFNEAITLYQKRRFNDSLRLFNRSREFFGKDTPSTLYIDRCEFLVKNPPEEDWDGVYTAKTK